MALGLVNEVVPVQELDAAIARITEALIAGAPDAQKAAKDLISAVSGQPIGDAVTEDTAQRIARRRATAEAKDGISAFLEKRQPGWMSST
jgi:methylglutaconyl-CoA hydratase